VAFKREGDIVVLIGETKGHLGQSIYLREVEGREEGGAPPVDLAAEKKNGEFVRGLIEKGIVDTVHDLSDGGLLVALGEMALAGDLGVDFETMGDERDAAFMFGEDQARYVVTFKDMDTCARVRGEAHKSGVYFTGLGRVTSEKKLLVRNVGEVLLADLRKAHEGWFPAYLAAPHTN
jgi:phosphoribosylformylglycinamidine synthase